MRHALFFALFLSVTVGATEVTTTDNLWRADNPKAEAMARDIMVTQSYLPPNVAAYINQVIAPRIDRLEQDLDFERRKVRALETRLRALQEQININEE